MKWNGWKRLIAFAGIITLLASNADSSFSQLKVARAEEKDGTVQAAELQEKQSEATESTSIAEDTETTEATENAVTTENNMQSPENVTEEASSTASSEAQMENAQSDEATSASSAVASADAADSVSSSETHMITVTYLAGEGGSVSLSQETADTQEQFVLKGSQAAALQGYEFVNWTDQDGTEVSAEENFVPELLPDADGVYADATYTANFRPIEEKPQFHSQTQLNGVTITLDADQGVLPAGATMKVQEVTSQVENKVTEEAADDGQMVTDVLAYDITLYSADGNEIPNDWSENGLVHVSFSGDRIADSSAEADSVQILHLKDNGSIDGTVADESLSEGKAISEIGFDASHFSVYAVTMYAKDEAGTELGQIEIAGTLDVYDATEVVTDTNTVEITTAGIDIAPDEIAKDLTKKKYIFKKATVITDGSTVSTDNPGDEIKAFNIYKVRTNDPNSKAMYKVQYMLKTDSDNKYYLTGNTKIYLWYQLNKTYQVSFYSNGSDGSAPESINGHPGDVITLPEANGTVEGKIFYGWSMAKKTSNTAQIYKAGEKYTIGKRATRFYALWTSPENGYFYIRTDNETPDEPAWHDPQAYTAAIKVEGAVKAEQTYMFDDSLHYEISDNHLNNKVAGVLSAFPDDSAIKAVYPEYDPAKEYVCWYVLKKAGSAWHIDGVFRMRTEVTVHYDDNKPENAGASHVQNMPADVSAQQGEEINVLTGADGENMPVLSGYKFNGWNTSKDGTGTAYSASGTVLDREGKNSNVPKTMTTDVNITLYAQWIKDTCKITYDFNTSLDKEYNKEHVTTYTRLRGSETPYPSEDPARENDAKGYDYKFAGWYAGTAEWNDTVTEDVTYTAQWTSTPVGYKVNYAYTGDTPADASKLPDIVTYTYGAEVTLADAATAAGYTFDGWKVNGKSIGNGKFTITQDMLNEKNPTEIEITGSFTKSGAGGNAGGNAGGTAGGTTSGTAGGTAANTTVSTTTSSTTTTNNTTTTVTPATVTPAVLGAKRAPAVTSASAENTEGAEITDADGKNASDGQQVLGAARGRATGDSTQDGMRMIVILVCAGAAGILVWTARKRKEKKHQ